MKAATIERSRNSFRGILRTPQGSVILVAVENMPIAPKGTLTVVTNARHGHPAEPQGGGAGVGQSIYIGQQYDTSNDYHLQSSSPIAGTGAF